MPVGFPQIDRPQALSGGADAWDNDLAGSLLSADYFAGDQQSTEPVYKGADGQSVVWLGARAPAQVYLGARTLF